MRPHRGFREALGDDRVVWLGQGVARRDLPERLSRDPPAVLGGPLTAPEVAAVAGVSTIALPLCDPVKRCQNQWAAAVADENHPFHADAHTFRFREVFEEQLPFGIALSNAALHAVSGRRNADPEAALHQFLEGRVVVGDPAFPKPFVREIARALGLPLRKFDPEHFCAPQPPALQGEALEILRRANGGDRALRGAMGAYWHGQQRVMTTVP